MKSICCSTGLVVYLCHIWPSPCQLSAPRRAQLPVDSVDRAFGPVRRSVRITVSRPVSFLTFFLDSQAYALPLDTVTHVTRAVEITHLPQSPPFLLGIINVQGQVLPVINFRRALGLPQRDIQLEDRILLVNTGRREIGIVVDAIDQVGGQAAESLVTAAGVIAPPLKSVQGVFIQEGNLVLVHNLECLLSLTDEQVLDKVIAQQGENP
jgi:purine-binding chemotaxis protein CheW